MRFWVNERSGLLTLAVYCTAALLIVLVALLGVFKYGAVARVESLGPIPAEPEPDVAMTQLRYKSRSPTSSFTDSTLDRQRVALLEGMLAEKTELIRQQAAQLEQRTHDLQDLRERYETALLAVDALQTPAPESAANAEEGAMGTDTAITADPTDVEAELMLARAVQDALVEDLDALQREYGDALTEISRLREEVSADTSLQLRDALALEAASAGIVMSVGQNAVPALIEALRNTNPVVRRWSATVLGGMGQDAGDAVGALTEALTDTDAGVRSAARAALDSIMR